MSSWLGKPCTCPTPSCGAAMAWKSRLWAGWPGSIARLPSTAKSRNPGALRSKRCSTRASSRASDSALACPMSRSEMRNRYSRQPRASSRRHVCMTASISGIGRDCSRNPCGAGPWPAAASQAASRNGLLDLDLVDKELEFSSAAGAQECEAGKVVAISPQACQRKCVLLPFRGRHEAAERGVLALGFGEHQEAAGLAVAFGPKGDVLLVGKVGRLHHTGAGRIHRSCKQKSGALHVLAGHVHGSL